MKQLFSKQRETKYRHLKTINEILSDDSFNPKRCIMYSKNASYTGFTPWFQDDDGFWIGIVRWYGANNKSLKIDYRFGKKRVWNFCRKIAILPRDHPIRSDLEKMESGLL